MRAKTKTPMALATTALAAVVLLVPGGAAPASNATWSGASPSDTWSTGADWSGGAAPSGSVGVLRCRRRARLPQLGLRLRRR